VASGNGATHELNQAGDYAAGPENGRAFSWFGKDQAAIDRLIVNPLTPDQLKALRDYVAAHTAVGAGNTDPEKVAMSLA
jgi:hypothetical protein